MLVKDISILSSDGTIGAAMQFAIYTNVIAAQYAVGFYSDSEWSWQCCGGNVMVNAMR